jgi:hypothetical protein
VLAIAIHISSPACLVVYLGTFSSNISLGKPHAVFIILCNGHALEDTSDRVLYPLMSHAGRRQCIEIHDS